jgi:hypothetical protein
MGETNKILAKEFDWDYIASKLEAIYGDVIQQWRRSRSQNGET